MVPYSHARMMALEEAIPDYLSGQGIFDYIGEFDWLTTSDDKFTRNVEYMLNRSGRKLASPLVARLVDEDTGILENNELETVGKIVEIRFRNKWNKIWAEFVSEHFLDNRNVQEIIEYGKSISSVGTDTLTKAGTETNTRKMDETHSEVYDKDNPFTDTRKITGEYTDSSTGSVTKKGVEEVTESFPVERKTSKVTSGGYNDADTTANTRTGSTLVTNKGDTREDVFGFNSSTAVPSSITGPSNAQTGITEETTYGEHGLIDTKSGAITRTYNNLTEAVTESGTKSTSTVYGSQANPRIDDTSDETTRSYDDYQEETTHKGAKSTTISYGDKGRVDKLEFTNRKDTTMKTGSENYAGSDTVTKTGYDFKSGRDKVEMLQALFTNPAINDFFEVVYSDIDTVLTCPIYV